MMSKLVIKNFRANFKCYSRFFDAHSVCDTNSFSFSSGVNILKGDIDTSGFCISYALSMLHTNGCDGFIRDGAEYYINNKRIYEDELKNIICYIDERSALFQTQMTVEEAVIDGLTKYNSMLSSDEIQNLFKISPDRYQRGLRGVGNERFKCMLAIAYANQKSIYCFPWMSKKQISYYGKNILDMLELLDNFDEITIFPTNYVLNQYKNHIMF